MKVHYAGALPIEAQAKHGLRRGAELQDLLSRLGADPNGSLVLVVDTSSSGSLRVDLRHDLERLRSGQESALHEVTKQLADTTDGGFATLRRLRIVVIDLDTPNDSGTRSAIAVLSTALVDPTQAEAAWHIIVEAAADASAKRLHITRDTTAQRLNRAGIQLRPRRPNERWYSRLDFTKGLLENHQSEAALIELRKLRKDMGSSHAEPKVLYALRVQESSALRQQERGADALQSAKEALDIDPNGLEALRSGSYAALLTGDLDEAQRLSDRAVTVAPNDVAAWITTLYIARRTGIAAPPPPAAVESSPQYLLARADIAYSNDDYDKADELSASVLQAGLRTPWSLIVRAQAKLAKRVGAAGTGRSDFQDVERWATEALELLATERHPLASVALALRADARRHMGKDAEAASDTERLQSLDPDDPNALRQMAGSLAKDGQLDRALAFLQRPSVERHPELLGLRARLLADLKRPEEARRDLQAAERLLANAIDPILARAQLGDVALILEDLATAERHLSELEAHAASLAPVLLLRARFLGHQGKHDEAAEVYRTVASTDPTAGPDVLREFGHAASRWERWDLAIQAFDLVGEQNIPETSLPAFAHALLEARELVRVRALVTRVMERDPVPTWAIGLAAELASRQGDTEGQIRALETLVGRRGTDANPRLYLIRGLLEVGRTEDAKRHLDETLALPSLTPIERMQAAAFLRQLGEGERAITEAFAAYRADPNSPIISKGFISTVLMSSGSPRVVTEVGPNTYIELKADDGRKRVHRIMASPPYNRQHDELSIADAEALGLLGKRVGDKVPQPPGALDVWRVEVIAPVEVQEANEAAVAYESRFPLEPIFLRGFHVGEGDEVRDFAPLIASVQSRKELVERAFALQAEQGLPLSMLARVIGVPLPDVMMRSDVDVENRTLHVEWSDKDGQASAGSALSKTRELILTRSALHTASTIGIMDTLTQAHRVVAPRTLRLELDNEIMEAERAVQSGRTTMGAGPTGLTIEQVPAGHPALVTRLEQIKHQREFVLANVRLEPRPLEVVARDSPDSAEIREQLGPSAYDAIQLAQHTGGVLYVDDLGLRRVSLAGSLALSCSTITLVSSLAERGIISPEQRDQWLVELVDRGYRTVLPTPELLSYVVAHAANLGPNMTSRVLGTLRVLPPLEGALILIEVVRNQALAGVVVMSVQEILRPALDAMAGHWPPRQVLAAVATQAGRRLQLLPVTLRECLAACRKFAEERLDQSGPMHPPPSGS